MNISELKLPSKGEINTYFIAGDWHIDHLDWPCLDIMIKTARKFFRNKKDRRLIINGDFLDAAHLMARNPQYKKWIKRSDGMDEYFIPKSEELDLGNKILDILQKEFSEIIYILGNHCIRYDLMMKSCPLDYSHNFDLRKKLKLTTRGIPTVNYNDWLDIGDKLSITHGQFHGTTCHKKHYEVSGSKSVIFSHIHHIGSKAFQVRGNTHHVWSLPALCDLNPEYIKNRETNWSVGFGIININHDSTFNFNIFSVWDNMLILPDGKVIASNLSNPFK